MNDVIVVGAIVVVLLVAIGIRVLEAYNEHRFAEILRDADAAFAREEAKYETVAAVSARRAGRDER
jgi:hypothetical protein